MEHKWTNAIDDDNATSFLVIIYYLIVSIQWMEVTTMNEKENISTNKNKNKNI